MSKLENYWIGLNTREQEQITSKLEKIFLILLLLAMLSGFLFFYRLGQYHEAQQIKRVRQDYLQLIQS